MAPIIAAVDPATLDRAPAWLGALVAGHTGAELLIAGVNANDQVVDRLEAGQLGEELSRDAGAALELIARELHDDGRPADVLSIGATSVPRGLELAVEELGAALLVVGSAVRGPRGRVKPGPAVERLLQGTPCAVAVTPHGWDHPQRLDRIGVGFVASAEGRVAVHDAHALAQRAGARLRMLAAVQPRPWMGGDHVADDLRDQAADAAASVAATLFGEPIDIDVEVEEPADMLVDASADLDLLVCGARAYGPEPATLLGGVTRQVTAEASCPVVVLARGAQLTLEDLIEG
jgi:nucleotide-binding universal stress UspA family protein